MSYGAFLICEQLPLVNEHGHFWSIVIGKVHPAFKGLLDVDHQQGPNDVLGLGIGDLAQVVDEADALVHPFPMPDGNLAKAVGTHACSIREKSGRSAGRGQIGQRKRELTERLASVSPASSGRWKLERQLPVIQER